MAFAATVYNCSDDPRKAVKTLPAGVPVDSITPTESCDILNPTFILSYKPAYTTCNYIIVGSPFNRHYFITDMKIDIGKKIVITCAVDVLSTYWDNIKTARVNVIRQENLNENNIPDPEFKLFSDFAPYNYFSDESYPLFPYSSDDYLDSPYCYVLTYAGGPYSGGGPSSGGGN